MAIPPALERSARACPSAPLFFCATLALAACAGTLESPLGPPRLAAPARLPAGGDAALRSARRAGDPFELKRLLAAGAGGDVERGLSKAVLQAVTAPDLAGTADLENWVRANPTAASEQRAFANDLLARLYHLHGRFADSAAAYQAEIEADPAHVEQDTRDALTLARVAAAVGPVCAVGAPGAILEAQGDFAHLIRLPVRVGAEAAPLIIDTGAEISVLAESTARRLGLRFLEGEVVVGTTTDNVKGSLAVADRIELGGMGFENVVFLVMADPDLTFADGQYFVDGILGLQVFRAARRMAWLDAGTRLAFGDAVALPARGTYPLFWHESGLGLGVPLAGALAPALLDSGAAGTRFTDRMAAALTPAERNALVEETQKRAGTGGEQTINVRRAARITLPVGDQALHFENAVIAPPESYAQAGRDVAVVGLSSLRQLNALILDFATMRYASLGHPAGAGPGH
jgi:Aspartyl protease